MPSTWRAADSPPVRAQDEQDVFCPTCEYNLRGLNEPRCPECGRRFTWESVQPPRFAPPPPYPGWVTGSILAVAVGLPLAICIAHQYGHSNYVLVPIAVAAWALLGFGITAAFALTISGVQTVVEYACVAHIMPPPSRRRFRAWWEGVLIGYGACAMTVMAAGLVATPLSRFGGMSSVVQHWPLLLLTSVESGVIQWWVVRYRARCWNEPVSAKRLTLACITAKAAVAICFAWVWSFHPL